MPRGPPQPIHQQNLACLKAWGYVIQKADFPITVLCICDTYVHSRDVIIMMKALFNMDNKMFIMYIGGIV